MATRSGTIGINIQFGKQRITVHIDKKMKLNAIIAQALSELKEEESGRHFILLHEGTALPGDATAEAALLTKSATVYFLQQASEPQVKTASQIKLDLKATNNELKDEKYGFCKNCESICAIQAIFTCMQCRKNTFMLSNPIDFFDDESVLNAKGICGSCGGEAKPSISYLCKGCDTNTVPFLRQLRSNVRQLPCMKCEKKDKVIFLFTCSSRHTMCFKCFHHYCNVMLTREKFKNFEMAGFSVCCPGTGADCPDTPVSDPHHFYIVDKTADNQSFYRAYTDKSIQGWMPPGDNIICTKCSVEVDVSRGTDTEVNQPAAASPAPVVTGSAWMLFKKMFQGPPPPPPPPQMRKKVACFRCQKPYCCVCKKNWHDGDCVIVDEQQVKEFSITPKCAAASKWSSS